MKRKLLVVDAREDYTVEILKRLSLDNSFTGLIGYKQMAAGLFLNLELTKEKTEALAPDEDSVF